MKRRNVLVALMISIGVILLSMSLIYGFVILPGAASSTWSWEPSFQVVSWIVGAVLLVSGLLLLW
jgi:hypothetical protein